MPDESSGDGTFTALFIYAGKSASGETIVMTAQSINGLAGYPSTSGPQPKMREYWKVALDGLNKEGAHYFVRCICKVDPPERPAFLRPQPPAEKPEEAERNQRIDSNPYRY